MDEEIKIKDMSDIDEALKEFEGKSSAEQIQKINQSSHTNYDDVPTMVRWVFKFSGGAIKEQKQAEYVLLGFTVLFFILTIFILMNLFSGDQPKIDKAAMEKILQKMSKPDR